MSQAKLVVARAGRVRKQLVARKASTVVGYSSTAELHKRKLGASNVNKRLEMFPFCLERQKKRTHIFLRWFPSIPLRIISVHHFLRH